MKTNDITLYDQQQEVAKTDMDITAQQIEKMQSFLKKVNRLPKQEIIATNQYANNSKYIPIGHLEMMLDKIFVGLWMTKNFQFQVIANEICGSIELMYFHPTAKIWITRIGAGAVQIQFKKDSDFTLYSNKIQKTLDKDLPHLKAECFRNACVSIGKSFGRDLNRKSTQEYTPEYKFDKVQE